LIDANMKMKVNRKNKPLLLISLVFVIAAILVFSVNAQSAIAHQRGLFAIGGKQYLLVVGSVNEPVFVDDKSGVDFFAYTPDPKNPMDSSANGTKPVTGLEKTLKVIVSAANKSQTFALEPAFKDPGHYNAPFYPTAQTTYSYTLNGTISNTPVNIKWTCLIGPESTSVINSIVKISDGVVRNGLAGSFGCPTSRTHVAFPEPYMSNIDIQNKLSQIGNKTTAK
jgi:hypothetical protein